MSLTPKQERFIQEYLIDLNATQAAIRAGYSAKSARSAAARMLAIVDIADAISAAQAKRAERVALDQDYVLNGLRGEAEFTGEGSSHSARVSAYHLLGKHLGMFKDRVEHSGEVTQTHIYLPAKDAPG